jgi:hypothetical protein
VEVLLLLVPVSALLLLPRALLLLPALEREQALLQLLVLPLQEATLQALQLPLPAAPFLRAPGLLLGSASRVLHYSLWPVPLQ